MEQKILSLKDDKIYSDVELYEYPAELIGGRNYFSIVEFESNKTTYSYRYAYYYHLQLEPNTKYTASTNDENGYNTSYANIYLYRGIFTATPTTVTNGVYLDRPITVISDSNGIVTLIIKHRGNGTDGGSDGMSYEKILNGETWLQLTKGGKAADWTPAPEDLGLTYPDFITEFKPSISDRYILTEELIEYPVELIGGRNLVSSLPINWQQGSFASGSLGIINSYKSRILTTDIKVTPNTTYTFSMNEGYEIWVPELNENKSGVVRTSAVFWGNQTFTTTSNTEYLYVSLRKTGTSYSSTNPEDFISPSDISDINIKLEKGNKATPWTPAPEDLSLSYPDNIQNFGLSFSNNILTNEFIEQ